MMVPGGEFCNCSEQFGQRAGGTVAAATGDPT